MSDFSGVWVPVVTPFHNGAIDFAALQRVCAHLISSGVDGLMVCCTTGEAASMTDAEQLAVLDAVLETVDGHRVVMGLSGSNFQALLDLQKRIIVRPVAGLLVPAPAYIRPSQEGLKMFFSTLANASSVPVILYDIPYRTGVVIEQKTLLEITSHPNIVAVKDCGGSLQKTTALLSSRQVNVLCGEDQNIFNALCLGASGMIAASAHIHPEHFINLYEQVKTGNLSAAREQFFQLLPLITQLFSEPNPAPLKAALSAGGLIRNELRAPLQPASDEIKRSLFALIERLGAR
ncbi:4-hydroxy-tetrahydrodipicolinate synthase [Pseudomonas putida]|uniref:4-hydroxy-tetrahydrodipicolinate synthase n=1 Tax=Pseudomonas putida TaxID=303 RepID=UPI00300F4039